MHVGTQKGLTCIVLSENSQIQRMGQGLCSSIVEKAVFQDRNRVSSCSRIGDVGEDY